MCSETVDQLRTEDAYPTHIFVQAGVGSLAGAVGICLMDLLANHTDFEPLKDDLDIGPDSTLLCFNTEGATDPVNYQEIIWHGKYPSID